MALFNRSKQNQKSVLPEEVSQYYQSQRRERTGVALVLGVVALVVTLLIGSALFFGGRYVYRQFSNNDKPATTEQTPAGNNQPAQSGKTPASSGAASTNSDNNLPGSDSSGAASTTAPKKTPSSSQTATPSLGDDTTLPHTGDPGM